MTHDLLDQAFLTHQFARIELRIRRYQSRTWDPENPYIVRKRHEILPKLIEARRRILEGGYGTCNECGHLISRARLDKIPGALLCTDCSREG